jgi:prepilin-type N-terminal cleavage/methylation domain-containing protein
MSGHRDERHGPATPGRRRRAFTIVEMVVSLMVLAVIVVAAGATITVAGVGSGAAATRWRAQAQSADAAAQVADDLNVALTVPEQTPTSVTVTVPDRVSLGSPNTIRYAWGGTGAPVTRQFNGGTAVPILPAADGFALTYQTRTYGPVADAALNLGTSINIGFDAGYGLTATAGVAQSFTPVLPSGTSSYTITRVQLPLESSGAADGAMAVRITTADALGRPTATVLGTAVVFEAQLSTTAYELVDVPFTNLSGLTPGQTLCVSVGYLFGTGTVGRLQYQPGVALGLNGQVWSTSSDGGTSWAPVALSACQPFNVVGTVP